VSASSTQRTDAKFPKKLKCLFAQHRYKVLYGGRGSGKSWGIARALLILGTQKPLRVLCAREFQASIADSVHQLLSDQIDALGLGHFYNIQNNYITGANGTSFSFEGLRRNIKNIKSHEGADIAWVEEAESVTKTSWNILIPTIRKDGSEIWVSFNPEFEDDETYVRFVLNPPKSAIVEFVNYNDNPFFPAVLEEERLSLKERDPDAYDHDWGGQCRRWLDGAIYANELRASYESNKITAVPWDPNSKVYTAWDIGSTDDTAIWWYQIVGGEIHIIESYAKSAGSPSHFASQITGFDTRIDIINGEPVVTKGEPLEGLEHRRTYDYGVHWLPHDAKAKTLAAAGKSVQEQLSAALGYSKVRITPRLSIEDGILSARTTFPRCWFDAEACAEGLKALRKYRREMQADDVSLQRNPKHDWTSHYADAFRYLAIAWREEVLPSEPEPQHTDAWGRPIHNDNDWMTT
jgi:phage terminase large subunit